MKKIVPSNAILIPSNAEKVFQGIIFDVYQWPQKMFDGATETFEMLKRPDTVEFIAIKDGKLLLIDEAQPGRVSRIRIPGGRVDPGHDWLTTAKRECQEELGMRFKTWRLIFVTQPISKIEWFGAVYLATDFIENVRPTKDNGEKITIVPHDFTAAKKIISTNNDPVMGYLRSVFYGYDTLNEFLNIPEFQGKEVER